MADYDLGTARGKIDIDASTLGRTTAAFDKVGKSLLGVGAVALAGFGLAVSSAASFEKSLSGTRAVMNGTEADMEKLRQKAFELGRTSQFTSKQVADGFESMAKAGLNARDILGGAADAAVALASAAGGGMNLDQASEIMVNAMKTFELGAGDLTHVADVLAGAANASTVEVDDLAVSLKYAGAVAHTQGVSIDELSTALAILGDRGIKGSTAGTSLRGVLLSLSPTSAKAASALKELGIITADGSNQFFDAKGNMKSFAEVAQILQDHTRGLSQEQKTQAFNTIFQRRAMASALILANQGAAGFANYAAEIKKISAADVAAIKLDNLAGRVKILKSSLQTLMIQFGEAFQKTLQGWAEKAIVVVNWMSSLDDSTKKTIATVVVIVGVLATLAGTFILVMSALVKTYRAARDFVKGVQLMIQVTKLMWATMAANPILIVIAALVAIGVALFVLYKKSQRFRDIVDSLWQVLQRLWDTLSGAGVKAWHALNTAVRDVVGAFEAAFRWVKANWDIILAVLTGGPGLIILVWRRFGDDIKNFIGGALDAVVGFFQALPGRIVGFITQVVSTFASIGSSLLNAIATGVPAAIQAFANFMAKLPYWAGFYIGFVIGRIIKLGIDLVTNMVQMGVDFVQAYVDFWMKLPGRTAEFITDIVGKVTTWVTDMVTKATELGTRFMEAIVSFFTQLPGRVWGFLVDTITRIAEFEREAIAKAISIGQGILNSVVQFLTQLPGKVASFLTSAVAAIRDKILSAGQAAREFGTRIFDALGDAIRGLPGQMGDILGRLISIIKDKIKDAFNAVKDFASGLWNGFKKGLGINSPSYIEEAMFSMTKNVSGEITTLAKQVGKIQKLGNSIADINPQANLQVASGAGILTPARQSVTAASTVPATSQPTGDVIHITGATEKTALEISREILFEKRVSVSA